MTSDKQFHVAVSVSISMCCWSQLYVLGLCGCLQERGSGAPQGRSVWLHIRAQVTQQAGSSQLPSSEMAKRHFLSFGEGQLSLLPALVVLWGCRGCSVLWFRLGTWSCPFWAARERVWSFPLMCTQIYPAPPATQTPASASLCDSKAQASTWSHVYTQNTMLICLITLLLKLAEHMNGV